MTITHLNTCRYRSSDELVGYLNFNELQMADLAVRKLKTSCNLRKKLFSEIRQLKTLVQKRLD